MYANIHIFDCATFAILRTLKFHKKGIQGLAFSTDGKYLVSVGNYRENTIAVWNTSTGLLISNSYTLTIINEIRVKPTTKNGLLEFATLGADTITQWVLTDEPKLIRNESFLHTVSTNYQNIRTINIDEHEKTGDDSI